MGIAATLYNRTIGPIATAVVQGRKEAQEGVRAARELSARVANTNEPVRDSVVQSAAPHAPDSGLRASASLQAPKAPQGRSLGVNAAGSQRTNLRLAQEPAKTDTDSDV